MAVVWFKVYLPIYLDWISSTNYTYFCRSNTKVFNILMIEPKVLVLSRVELLEWVYCLKTKPKHFLGPLMAQYVIVHLSRSRQSTLTSRNLVLRFSYPLWESKEKDLRVTRFSNVSCRFLNPNYFFQFELL